MSKLQEEHINIFIAYSRKDTAYLKRLQTYLKPLMKPEKLNIWYDGEIVPGEEWEQKIKKHLHLADIILLLITADSLASDYFYEKEMTDAFKRHQKGEAAVIPIILRPCLWQKNTTLGTLQALPKDGKALSLWQHIDSGYTNIVEGIDENIQIIKEKRLKVEQQRIAEIEKLATLKRKQEEEEKRKVELAKQMRLAEMERQKKELNVDAQKNQQESTIFLRKKTFNILKIILSALTIILVIASSVNWMCNLSKAPINNKISSNPEIIDINPSTSATIENDEIYAFDSVEVRPRLYIPNCEVMFRNDMAKAQCAWSYKHKFFSIECPHFARENGMEGKVVITFVVEKDGSITNPEVIQDIGGRCREEALRVMKNMPKWIPGKQGNSPVRVQFNLEL